MDPQRMTVDRGLLHHAVCVADDCDRPPKSKTADMCYMHFRRVQRTGSVNGRNRGRKKHPLHHTYTNMKRRCYSQTCPRYKDYGGRGITMSDRWLGEDGFENFVADMGPKPAKGYSVERVDNDSGYSPENCVWATRFEQAQNTRVESNAKYVGVNLSRWGYRAYINKNGKQKHLGYFDRLEDAITARSVAKEVVYGS